MMFLAGWLLHSIPLAAALGLALMAMQAPAVTHEYQTALLQLVRSSEQEIAQRRVSTRSTTRRLCRPLGRRFETVTFTRARRFESGSLQQRVCEPSVPERRDAHRARAT